MADLAGAIDQGVSQLQGRARRLLDSLSGELSFRVGALGLELTQSASQSPYPVLAVRALLQKLVDVAQHHDLILVFDEFSRLAQVTNAAELLPTELHPPSRDKEI